MCKLSDDFSGVVNTCGTGKRNRVGALALGNRPIVVNVDNDVSTEPKQLILY